MTHDITSRVQNFVEEILGGTPMYIVEVNVRGARGSRVVDVYVDSDEGVGVDELSRISRELGFLLDSEDVFDSKYNLNVSSPGLDRPLEPRQFRKMVGRELVIECANTEENPALVVGTLDDVKEDAFTLKLSTSEHPQGGDKLIPFERVREARVRLPW